MNKLNVILREIKESGISNNIEIVQYLKSSNFNED